ncbi:hypothetical protein [Nocardia pseudobrasiliensis]|uniref:hypothetical protein n=1 Tax=Nocardia pseudobrasiliensis TaxID=45979 RepID=UPI0012E7581D|nr:hypothetical protein [Nocardia pseudobrasiliensis]
MLAAKRLLDHGDDTVARIGARTSDSTIPPTSPSISSSAREWPRRLFPSGGRAIAGPCRRGSPNVGQRTIEQERP